MLIALRHVLRVLRPCIEVIPVMAHIWIVITMVLGVSRIMGVGNLSLLEKTQEADLWI